MIAALLFMISLVTLLQFFDFYSHALIAESSAHTLSDQTREICGIEPRKLAGEHFLRLAELITLCPEPGGDGGKVMVVSAYFHLLNFVRRIFMWAIPFAAAWIEAELRGCAYVAAVVLDRRIACSRLMMAQQTSRSI